MSAGIQFHVCFPSDEWPIDAMQSFDLDRSIDWLLENVFNDFLAFDAHESGQSVRHTSNELLILVNDSIMYFKCIFSFGVWRIFTHTHAYANLL